MFKYSLLILIGAISYGILSTIVKLAYAQGFHVQEVVGSQFLFGWMLLLFLVLIFSRKKVSFTSWLYLMGAGMTSSLVGIFYYTSLQTLPASLAILLLFQFTWLGILIEAIYVRKRPGMDKVVSIFILLIGTLLAGNVFEIDGAEWNLTGTIFGLLSAICFALFIFFSGRVALQYSTLNRSFCMVTGGLLLVWLVFPPEFLGTEILFDDLWKYALPLGIFGMVIPTFCFSIGVPKVGTGLGTILGSAELPTAILLSMVILNEKVIIIQWMGVILILVGIAIPQFFAQKRVAHSPKINKE
jgi:drug/metabolite transporter (DMT)-like permease